MTFSSYASPTIVSQGEAGAIVTTTMKMQIENLAVRPCQTLEQPSAALGNF
jgi:hypothetical protein